MDQLQLAERKPTEQLTHVVIRLAGDSGDGMQLTGDRFTSASALFGNDLSTFPDYPSEIRAPAGTVAGVSSFQIHISDHDITTPGDQSNVLVAMNPAALKADLHRLEQHGLLLVNVDTFDTRQLEKAGYHANPLTDGTLDHYRVVEVPMTTLTENAAASLDVKARDAERAKNFFALGLLSWLYSRPTESTVAWIEKKFSGAIQAANLAAFRAGYSYGDTTELLDHRYTVEPARLPSGEYTNISGNVATAWGLIAASQSSGLDLFLGSYPITPATDILHELSKHKNYGVRTVQAEDEIAAIGMALGASFAGQLAVTTTSGPGVALKSETTSLAVALELPLIIVDVQRGGPSTGLPTKTEAGDLNIALTGRHGDAPLPVVAAYSPSNCFDAAFEAARIALKYRTPVILLTDGYLANGAEPWLLPDFDALPDISVEQATEMNHLAKDGTPEFWPYLRDPETLARPWAVPGTPGLMHRVGGVEKEDGSGNLTTNPDNHSTMMHLRHDKIAGISDDIPPARVAGDADAEVCLVGWGSTWAAIDAAVQRTRRGGGKVAWIHLTHLNPLPANLGDLLRGFERVVVPELNMGQLCRILRAEYLVDAVSVTKVKGLPFSSTELENVIRENMS